MSKDFNVNEYSSWLLSKESPHNIVIVCTVDGNIEPLKLNDAANAVADTIEILGYSITSEYSAFIDRQCDIVVSLLKTDECWESVCERELSTPFKTGDPLIRISILNNSVEQYLVLCHHHIAGDGISGINFLQKMIDKYNDPGVVLENTPSRSKLLSYYPGKISAIHKYSGRSRAIYTKIKNVRLDEALLTMLKINATAMRCSVHSLIASLILKSMYQVFDIDKINLCCSVNLRHGLGHTSNIFAFLTSWINFDIREMELRQLCKNVYAELKKQLKIKQQYCNLEVLTDLVEKRTSDQIFANQFISKEATLCSSFLDNINFGSHKKMKQDILIKSVNISVNAQSYMGTKDSLTASMIILNQKYLEVNFNYPSPLINQEIIETFSACFKKNVEKLIYRGSCLQSA